jgi:hypothetical protein
MYRYSKYEEFILENQSLGLRPLARQIIKDNGLDFESEFEALVGFIRRLKKRHHKALEKECKSVGIPVDNVNHYWYKGKNFSIYAKGDEVKFNDEDIQEAVKGALEGYSKPYIKTPKKTNKKALKVVISDAHVGLDPDPDGESLFNYQYGPDIFFNNLDTVYQSIYDQVINNGSFDLFILDDLGDGLDGYNGFTTRGGHKLDQNLTNKEAFNTYVKGKYELIRRIVELGVAKKYIIRNISNCNHGGDFGWMANRCIELMIENSIEANIEYDIIDKFMKHYKWGDHTFILSHGKDKKFMNRGLPLNLNDRAINFINDYLDHYDINTKYIHVEKGDLHQVAYQRTKKFDYRNYMSFAPPSAWVTHNFGDCYSGYSLQIIPKDNNQIQHIDYFFDLVKG